MLPTRSDGRREWARRGGECTLLIVTLFLFLCCVAWAGGNLQFDQKLAVAQTLVSQGRTEEAIEAFKDANKLAKERSPECYLGLASAYLSLGKNKDAIKASEKLLSYADSDAHRLDAHNIKGVALIALDGGKGNQLAKAESEFRAAVSLNLADPTVHFNLGVTLLKQGRDDEGLVELKKYLAQAPEGLHAHQAKRLAENPRRARHNFAPEFTLETLGGHRISSEELLGKVILLDFWATWCAPCVGSIPDLKAIHESFPEDRFALISVSVDHDHEKWKEFVVERELNWTQSRDVNGTMVSLFVPGNKVVLPTYIVIDGEGIFREVVVGEGRRQMMKVSRAVEQCLEELQTRH